jgi:hypothetical protein
MADESIWTGAVPYVQDGDAVSAAITNPPIEVLAARTQALRDLVNAIEAGEQITLRNAPLAESISAGTVVFFDATELVHDKSFAQWLSLSGATELRPASETVYTGVVIRKTAERAGDILVTGYSTLGDSELTNLFGTTTPASGTYYLSMLTPGTVELTPPAMMVRVLQVLDGGIIRVFSPSHEPISHTHRSYVLQAGDWLPAASFDPTGVPDNATHGYDLTASDAVSQAVSAALVPTTGEASFVWSYGGHFASNVIDTPVTPAAHSITLIISVGGSLVLTVTNDTGIAYTATPTLSGSTHVLGCDSTPTDTQYFAALAHLLDQLDDVSASANGAVSVTITADVKATSTYDIIVTGTAISGGHLVTTAITGILGSADSGIHVSGDLISLNSDGIWWVGVGGPGAAIDVTVVTADARGLSLISAIQSLSPEAIAITSANGVVSVQYLEYVEVADVEGSVVVKQLANHQQHRGSVVEKIVAGRNVILNPSGGQGTVTIEFLRDGGEYIEAPLQNLNNAITSVEDPHVFTMFPNNRTSSVSCRVTLPNLSAAIYYCRIFAQFLSPGANQVLPTLELVRIPTPSAAGVTPTGISTTTWPNIPAGAISGNVYYVESDDQFSLEDYSQGVVAYTMTVASPVPELRMINTGIRLYIP